MTEEDFAQLMRELLDHRSYSVMQDMATEAKGRCTSAAHVETLTQIESFRKLDEIWMKCHDELIAYHKRQRDSIYKFLTKAKI